jgi:hypothetical protein
LLTTNPKKPRYHQPGRRKVALIERKTTSSTGGIALIIGWHFVARRLRIP